MTTFRKATSDDVPSIVAMLRDDALGAGRETAEMADYLCAFDNMQAEASNHLIVGERDGRIVATYQIIFIQGLSLRAARRAQVESVRVASDLRGQGIGKAMFADIERRARATECSQIQLTSNASRDRARRFYERLGFTASHVGYKRDLT